jgi:hypothetical protein
MVSVEWEKKSCAGILSIVMMCIHVFVLLRIVLLLHVRRYLGLNGRNGWQFFGRAMEICRFCTRHNSICYYK